MRFIQYSFYGILFLSLSIICTPSDFSAQASPTSSSAAGIESKNHNNIKYLINSIRSKKLGKQVMMQMIQQFKALSAKANVPDDFWAFTHPLVQYISF